MSPPRRLSLLTILIAQSAVAQTELAGTWQGSLQVDPETALTVHFVITETPDGGYAAMLTSPDTGGIKDVPADAVTFTNGSLRVDVAPLNGFYAGVLRDGVIEGEWSQQGAVLPLDLRPYAAPVLSRADIETLLGPWSGKLRVAGLELTMIFRFEVDEDGNLTGTVESPEQGAQTAPVADIALDDGDFSLKVPAAVGEYAGRLSGDRITGEWRQGGGTPIPLTLTKGESDVAAGELDLDLPQAARRRLAGRWHGTLGPLSLVLRFEMDEQGRVRGFVDSPDQGASDLPVTEATLADDRLTLRLAAIGAQYSGELVDDTIEGEWTQAGMSNPLTFTRE